MPFHSDALTCGALLTLEGLCPPRARQFLEIVNDLPVSPTLICKPTNPEPTPLTTFSIRLSPQGHHPPALITHGPGTRQPGMAPMPQSLPEVFRPAGPQPGYPTTPLSSHRNANEGSCPHLPLTPLPPEGTWFFLGWLPFGMACPLLLETVNNKLPFQWQSSADQLAFPYLNNNKTCILFYLIFFSVFIYFLFFLNIFIGV